VSVVDDIVRSSLVGSRGYIVVVVGVSSRCSVRESKMLDPRGGVSKMNTNTKQGEGGYGQKGKSKRKNERTKIQTKHKNTQDGVKTQNPASSIATPRVVQDNTVTPEPKTLNTHTHACQKREKREPQARDTREMRGRNSRCRVARRSWVGGRIGRWSGGVVKL